MKVLKKITGWAAGMLAAVALFSMSANAQDAPQLSDPEIGHIVVTANQIDVDYAKLAQKKTKNKIALDYAATMIKDHEALIEATKELANKLGVTPEDNAVSQSLLDGAKETTAKLKKLKGDEFAKAYIDNEVAYHEAVINSVKTLLIPQSENTELKETLESVMPLLEHHLEMAKEDQAKL